MMNVLALSLVLTTLVTAGVFSPSPEKKNHGDDVIVKEGHRTVVVEYENDDRSNTRVSISPQESHEGLRKSAQIPGIKDNVEDAKETLKEFASEHLPNMGEGISGSEKDKEDGHGHRASPRELVCDAYGKCKHKISSAIGRTKDKFVEKASEAAEKIHDVEEEVKEDVKEAFDKVKDKVKEKSHGISDMVYEAKEKVKDGAEVAFDTGKTLKGDEERNASTSMESTKNKVEEKAKQGEEIVEQVKDGAHEVKEEGKKDFKEILHRGREVGSDAFSYVVSREKMAASVRVMELLGTANAFGMSIWVTFISSYILARALPRQQFAMVQSKIYPVYFKAMAYSIGAVLIGHLLSQRKRVSSGGQGTFQSFNLLAALVMDLVNLLILEPRATKVVFDKMKMEKEESSSTIDQQSARIIGSMTESAINRASGAPETTTTTTAVRAKERQDDRVSKAELIRLSKILRKLNSVSSFLNILTLMVLTWHLVHLGQALHSVC